MAIDQKVREYTPKYRDIVARAWADEAFKARLVKEPKAVLIEEGIELSADKQVRVIEPAEGAQLLLLPPDNPDGAAMLDQMVAHSEGEARQLAEQYAALIRRVWVNPALKQRFIAEPAAVLQEQGSSVPDGRELRVLDLAPNEVPLVLPPRPHTGELTDDELDLVIGGITDKQLAYYGGIMTTVAILLAAAL